METSITRHVGYVPHYNYRYVVHNIATGDEHRADPACRSQLSSIYFNFNISSATRNPRPNQLYLIGLPIVIGLTVRMGASLACWGGKADVAAPKEADLLGTPTALDNGWPEELLVRPAGPRSIFLKTGTRDSVVWRLGSHFSTSERYWNISRKYVVRKAWRAILYTVTTFFSKKPLSGITLPNINDMQYTCILRITLI